MPKNNQGSKIGEETWDNQLHYHAGAFPSKFLYWRGSSAVVKLEKKLDDPGPREDSDPKLGKSDKEPLLKSKMNTNESKAFNVQLQCEEYIKKITFEVDFAF